MYREGSLNMSVPDTPGHSWRWQQYRTQHETLTCSPRHRRPLAPRPPNLSNTPQFAPGTRDTEPVGHPTQLNMPLDHSTAHVQRSDGQGDNENIRPANLVSSFMAMGGLHPVWLSRVPIVLDSGNSFFLTSGSHLYCCFSAVQKWWWHILFNTSDRGISSCC